MPIKAIYSYNADEPTNDDCRQLCAYQEVTECPSCHYAIQPKVLNAYFVQSESDKKYYDFYLLALCTKCRRLFLSKFSGGKQKFGIADIEFEAPSFSVPFTPALDKFSEDICSLSPGFVETYAQANVAEAHQLYQICGVGYRKSLEYLVKDYLCHKYPDDTEKIRSEFLGASIKRIEDSRVKVLAERSTWIGNDETHYVRKHNSLDFSDMKRFIKAILNYVESELAFEEATSITSK